MMKRLLCVLLVLVAGGVGLGFYQGWFAIGSESADGKSHINITVDKDKIQQDEKKALERMHDARHQVTDKVTGPAKPGKSSSIPPVRQLQDQE